jgi:hypothetical protein
LGINSKLTGGTQATLAQSSAGAYNVTVTATSSTGDTVTKSFTLTVTKPADINPTFFGSFTPSTVNPGQTSVLNWSGTDLVKVTLVNAELSVNQTYTNQASGALTITTPNDIRTHLVAYTATSSTNTVITGTIPLAIQLAVVIPSITGSFSVPQPTPNQTTVLTFVPGNAVSVRLVGAELSIDDSYTVVSGTSYTKNVTSPSVPGTYNISMIATSSSGDNRTATASFTVLAVFPTVSASFSALTATPGQVNVLSWTATNAITISIVSTDLSLNLSFGALTGTYSVVAPASIKSYSVTVTATSVTGTTASAAASFTVKAAPIVPTVNGSFSPYSVNPGQLTTLTWNTTNTNLMSVTGDATSSELNGTATVTAPAALGKRTVNYRATSTTNDTVSGTWVYEVVAVTPIIPTLTGSFNPTSVILGQSSTFTWSSTNAILVQYQLADAITNVSTSGSVNVTPSATGTQSIGFRVFSSTGDFINPTFNLSVAAAEPPTVTGSFSPTSITLGEATTFAWSSTNATALTISGLVNSNLLNGARTITPSMTGTQTISYTATSPGNPATSGTFTLQVNAAVVPVTPIVTGSFSPASVTAGQSSTFTWSSTNATNLLLSGAVSSTALNGTTTVTPAAAGTSTVNYTAISSTNTALTGQFDLIAITAPPITPTVSGSFSPASITLGQTTTLTWSSTNATRLTLTGNVTSSQLNGTSSITPTTIGTKTVNYTATSNTGTVITGSFTVSVAAAALITPVVNGSFSPLSITLGQTTTLTWSSTNATTLALSGAVTSSQLNGSSAITPTTTGTKTVNYTATSSTSTTTTGTFAVTVNTVTPIYPTVNEAGTYWSQYSVTPGQQNTLTWKIDNAVSASISGLVTSSAVSGSATITVPTTPGTYSAYMDATSSTGHKLQAGSDGKLPRHTDLVVVAAAALKGSITSPAALSSKQQRQIVITGDATAGTQNYTVTLSTGTVDTTTGSPLTGTIGSNSLTICLKGTNSAGTATLTLSKSGYTNYSGSVAYAANTKYSPYLLTAGFPQESLYTSAKLTTATWIANNLYKGIATAYTTALGTRYGLGRAPDYGGLVFWTNKCVTTYAGNYSGSAFLSDFFAAAGGTDLTNSKTASKTYNPGTGYGDFYDRPN